jgi:glycosyltransferase involved in cell wall biosynthesis
MQDPERHSAIDILFVVTSLAVGGTERQLALLATTLAKDGMRLVVFSFNDGVVRGELERAGVEVIVPGSTFVPSVALRLFSVMRARRPRIAHFFLPAAYLVGAPLAALSRVPARLMSRRSLNNYQRIGLMRGLERLWHRTLHAVVGNSRHVVEQLRAEGVPAGRLGLIYNGIDASRYDQDAGLRGAARAQLGIAPDALTFVIVANLIPYKGHGDLIDALAQAAPVLPAGWRLLVVGRDDGMGADLRGQAARLGLAANILFLGSRDDVPAILAASDIGLLCSHEEGFSNAVLEGMAAGLPMAVTAVGGNSEAVVDGESGLVVPARDSAALATAIGRLAGDAALRRRMGEAGRRRVVERFSVASFVERHRALYAALRAGRAPFEAPEGHV